MLSKQERGRRRGKRRRKGGEERELKVILKRRIKTIESPWIFRTLKLRRLGLTRLLQQLGSISSFEKKYQQSNFETQIDFRK